jgi:hypothetical protein
MTNYPERTVSVNHIPEPPPEEWHQQDGEWQKDGQRVEPIDGGKWGVYPDSTDEGWVGPFGSFDTAEAGMRALETVTTPSRTRSPRTTGRRSSRTKSGETFKTVIKRR